MNQNPQHIIQKLREHARSLQEVGMKSAARERLQVAQMLQKSLQGGRQPQPQQRPAGAPRSLSSAAYGRIK